MLSEDVKAEGAKRIKNIRRTCPSLYTADLKKVVSRRRSLRALNDLVCDLTRVVRHVKLLGRQAAYDVS